MNDKQLALFLLCGLVFLMFTSYYTRQRFIEEINTLYRTIMIISVMSVLSFLGYKLTKIIFTNKSKTLLCYFCKENKPIATIDFKELPSHKRICEDCITKGVID